MKKLPLSFYLQDTLTLSRLLLGKYLVHVRDGQKLVCRITETEAYLGPIDRASHAYGWRRTDRTETMFRKGGCAYVYLIYGMYDCMNVVAEAEEMPCAVLIRAGEPVAGTAEMAYLRYGKPLEELTPAQMRNFANGPGKLCKAMGITRALNGTLLNSREFYIAELPGEAPPPFETAPRVNIDYAGEDAAKPWRFIRKAEGAEAAPGKKRTREKRTRKTPGAGVKKN